MNASPSIGEKSKPAGTAQKKRSQKSRYSATSGHPAGRRAILYFDNNYLALGVDTHQIGTAIVAQADLGLDHDLVAQE
jgi:hypothetical protein